MSWWSSVKSAVKKVVKVVSAGVKAGVRAAKALGRLCVRLGFAAAALVVNVFDLLLGFITWPEKTLRLHVVVLRRADGTVVMDPAHPDLTAAIANARRIYKDRFNVKLVPYGDRFVETATDPAPMSALNPHCDAGAWADEFFREAGEYYVGHLAGWVSGIPISASFPVTAYIVDNVQGKRGCAIGPTTDYVVVDREGIYGMGGQNDETTLAHEIGHCCNLDFDVSHWPPTHSGSQSNLMWADWPRGDGVKWYQKNLVRSSRHVTYW